MTKRSCHRIVPRTNPSPYSWLGSLVILFVVALWGQTVPQPASADLFRGLFNWDVGEFKIIQDNNPIVIKYKDAHLKITTKGSYPPGQPDLIIKGDFDEGKATLNGPLLAENQLNIDFKSAAGVTGKTHIGVHFTMDVAGTKADYKIEEAKLTDITGPNNIAFASLNVPISTELTYYAGPSQLLFDIDPAFPQPSIQLPQIEDLELFKSLTPPTLPQLNGNDFPAIPKTPLPAVPNLPILPTPLGAMQFLLPSLVAGDWLLGSFRTTWTDGDLTAAMGEPIRGSVDTWFAMQIVPEPSTWILMAAGAILLGAARCRRNMSRLRSGRRA